MQIPSSDRGHLATEQANPAAAKLESLSVLDAVDFLRHEDQAVLGALEAAREALAGLVECAGETLVSGGRIFYVGAGTSGRLGFLDASECPPTFGVPPDRVQAILAGGLDALVGPVERAEDDAHAAAKEIQRREVSDKDLVIGIAAGGTTPFVHGALAEARQSGATTALIACVPASEVADDYDHSVRLLVGPEVLAGSSRMKAGTATKLALNAITTLAMVRLGKTYRGHMVDVDTKTNSKLVDRGARLISQFAGVDRPQALELLKAADGHAKTAIVMGALSLDAGAARARLESAGGFLERVLDSDPRTDLPPTQT